MIRAGRPQGVRRGISLRLKLTLWMLAISVVIQTMVATLLLIYQKNALQEFFDDRISTRSQRAAAAVVESGDRLTDSDMAVLAEKSPQFVGFERFVVSLYTKDGEVLASSVPRASTTDGTTLIGKLSPAGRYVGRATVSALVSEDNPGGWGRIVAQRLRAGDGNQYVLLFAATDTRYEAMMNLSMTAVWIAIPTGVLATGVAGWLIGGLAVAPLRQLARVANSLAPDSEEPDFDPPRAPPEIAALERDLQETRSKLRQAFHAQERFISNVAHELKTPIAVLLTEAETLPKNNLPAAERVVKSAAEEMERLGRMVESFLTLTRVRGGQALAHPEPCSLNEVVMASVESCRIMARQFGVLLSPELAESDPMVAGEFPLLTSMVDNLVRNAVRFSPKGEAIVVRVSGGDAECEITVRDAGPGVPAELMDTLFDRFVQGPGENVRGRGHGLGLSIAQGIAELHGGRIAVQNNADRGCEFTVRVPRIKDH